MRARTIVPVAVATFFGLAVAQAVPKCALPALNGAIRDYPGECSAPNVYICFCQNQQAQWHWIEYANRDCPNEADVEAAIAFGTRLCIDSGFPITFPVPSPSPTPSSTADEEGPTETLPPVTPTASDPPPATSNPVPSGPDSEPSETPNPTNSSPAEPPASTITPSTFITTPSLSSPTGTRTPCTKGASKTKTIGTGGDGDEDCDCSCDGGDNDNDNVDETGNGDGSGNLEESAPTPTPTFVLVNMAEEARFPIALGFVGAMAALLGLI